MKAEIQRLLGSTSVVGRELICLEEVDSTNSYARELARSGGADGTVVIADSQTAGRGRQGRSFQSPRGRGLYLSVLLRPDLPPDRLTPVTALAGVAVCGAVERVCGVRPGIKWPNDPVLEGRKVCGILTELTGEGALIVGIGINVSQRAEDFTPDVAAMATSLAWALGRPVSRPALAAALIRELDRQYAALRSGAWQAALDAYRRDCVNLGRQVQLLSAGDRETVTAVGVDEDFGLMVRDAAGAVRTIHSGEVSVRGLYGYVDSEEDAAFPGEGV